MVYGSTEAEPIASIRDSQISATDAIHMRNGGGLIAGKPVPGCEVRIVRTAGIEARLPMTESEFAGRCKAPLQIGEILVHGRHVLTSYADQSCNRTTKVRVGDRTWHRTGDAGYFDERGCLWLVGRISAAIEDNFGLVFPFQIEYAVSAIPGIRRSALVQHRGQRLLVIEAPDTGSRALSAVAERARRFRVDRVVACRRIPVDKRHNAKVDYDRLQRLLNSRRIQWRFWLIDAAFGTVPPVQARAEQPYFQPCRSALGRFDAPQTAENQTIADSATIGGIPAGAPYRDRPVKRRQQLRPAARTMHRCRPSPAGGVFRDVARRPAAMARRQAFHLRLLVSFQQCVSASRRCRDGREFGHCLAAHAGKGQKNAAIRRLTTVQSLAIRSSGKTKDPPRAAYACLPRRTSCADSNSDPGR